MTSIIQQTQFIAPIFESNHFNSTIIGIIFWIGLKLTMQMVLKSAKRKQSVKKAGKSFHLVKWRKKFRSRTEFWEILILREFGPCIFDVTTADTSASRFIETAVLKILENFKENICESSFLIDLEVLSLLFHDFS